MIDVTRTVSMGEAQRRLKGIIQDVQEHKSPYILTRFGKPQALIVNIEEYKEMQKDLSLLPRVAEARAIYRAGRVTALDSTPLAAEATCEGDVLRLHQPLPLGDRQRVWVIVIPVSEPTSFIRETPSPDTILNMAAEVYEGLLLDDVDEIERIALDRSHFFTGRE